MNEYLVQRFIMKKLNEGYTVKKVAENMYSFTILRRPQQDIDIRNFFKDY
jgi:hypothetical protein